MIDPKLSQLGEWAEAKHLVYYSRTYDIDTQAYNDDGVFQIVAKVGCSGVLKGVSGPGICIWHTDIVPQMMVSFARNIIFSCCVAGRIGGRPRCFTHQMSGCILLI